MKLNLRRLDLENIRQYVVALCIIGLIMNARDAFAADDDPTAITTVLCNVLDLLEGTAGKVIASLAIIILGIGLFIGKLSWPVALATAVGVGIIFGAEDLVEWLAGGKAITDTCSTS
ncbi:MAG: TrbC/VirB2 family protein [Rickettsiales bacterium]|nr:TrbC/VirB2 family protein [Rickettsiales bacterium]